MGLIARESTAPIRDGEKVIAADVENEFAKVFTAIGESGAGTLDTANFARAANIVGTQFTNTTIAAGKFEDDTLQVSRFAASAVQKVEFTTASNSGTMTGGTSMSDVEGLNTLSLTPGSTDDIVTMTLLVTFGRVSAVASEYVWGFNIDDGTGDVVSGWTEVSALESRRDNTHIFRHVMTATAASATVYKARYKRVTAPGGSAGEWTTGLEYNAMLHVKVSPIKP